MSIEKTNIALAKALKINTENLIGFILEVGLNKGPIITAQYYLEDEGLEIGLVERTFSVSLLREEAL